MKITRRKLHKTLWIIKNTRFDRNFPKFLFNLYKRYLQKRDADKPLPYPTTLMLELTNKCNLKCTMCPREHQFGRDMKIGNMDSALAMKVIDECYPYLQSIGLTGLGETLFAPNLVDIAKYIKAKKKSIVIFISTNANIPGFIDKITPVLPYIDTLQISIDGVGDTYDKIRQGSTFQQLDTNLGQLKNIIKGYGIDTMFNMVVSPDNYFSMSNVIDFAHKHDIRFINFATINLASIPELDNTTYDFFKSTAYNSARIKAIEQSQKYPDIEITGLDQFQSEDFHVCPLVYNSFQINHDGTIPPCCAKPFSKLLSFGNVNNSKLISILNGPIAKDFQRNWQQGRIPDFCKHCNNTLLNHP